jgi:hypothetical protein
MKTSLRVIEQSTNAHVPFRSGEIIDFAGDEYLVLRNAGHFGTVREATSEGATVRQFYWEFAGVTARRTGLRLEVPQAWCESALGCDARNAGSQDGIANRWSAIAG